MRLPTNLNKYLAFCVYVLLNLAELNNFLVGKVLRALALSVINVKHNKPTNLKCFKY